METIIAQLLKDYEHGKMTRRQLIQSLALATTTVSAIARPGVSASAANGFKTTALDHISYQVSDYRKTRDFYADLMGMAVSEDNGATQCELHFGESMLIARNRSAARRSTVDHIAYRVADWDTDKIKAELERRKLKPQLDTGTSSSQPNYASFHVQDPDGFDLQISGVPGPGDSLYRKSAV